MNKYPFTPEFLDALPEELAELFRSLEITLLEEICSRLNLTDSLNEVTVQDIRALRAQGINLNTILDEVQRVTKVGGEKLNQLLTDVVSRNQKYYTEAIDLAGLTVPEVILSERDIEAIKAQAMDEYRNVTGSYGFLVGKQRLPPADAYQWALDQAELQVQSGAISYSDAIRGAVQQLADSGLKTVDYSSGVSSQLDVAVRRAVMTGTNQLCQKYTDAAIKEIGTDFVEVSAHSGARDKPGPSPWSSHKAWQGKIYSLKAGDKYPSIYEVCGLGYVDGILGANCRHHYFPFVEGVSERTYTDEELGHIDDELGCTYQGRNYSAYEATQQQRKLERTIRKVKRRVAAFEAAGLEDDETSARTLLWRLNQEYTAFSKAAGLPRQIERLEVLYN